MGVRGLQLGSSRRRVRVVGAILLVICIAAAMGSGEALAKKKKSKAKVFNGSTAPNLVVPDPPPGNTPATIVTSTITVPKKFKGKVVGDLNITGVKSTGDTAVAANGLDLMLVGPRGRAVLFDAGALNGQSIGPVTFDDDTPTSFCADPPCSDPDATLMYPYVGTTNLVGTFGGDTGPLSAFNGTPMRGVWTLWVWDNDFGGNNVLNTWGLQVTPAKPVTG